MSFPQTANVGVKLSAYERTLLVPSSKHGSIVTAGWEVFGEHLYYNNQAFTTWGCRKQFLGTQLQDVPMRDLKFILPHPTGLSWAHSLNWRGHDSFSFFGHFILHCRIVSCWNFHGDWNIIGEKKSSVFWHLNEMKQEIWSTVPF